MSLSSVLLLLDSLLGSEVSSILLLLSSILLLPVVLLLSLLLLLLLQLLMSAAMVLVKTRLTTPLETAGPISVMELLLGSIDNSHCRELRVVTCSTALLALAEGSITWCVDATLWFLFPECSQGINNCLWVQCNHFFLGSIVNYKNVNAHPKKMCAPFMISCQRE